MPKTTTAGPTNAWEPPPPVTCAECGAQVAAGAPRCPECPSTSFEEISLEAATEKLAAAQDGAAEAVTELVAAEARLAEAAAPQPADGEPEAEAEAEAVLEPQAPDAVPEPAPAVPPRTPPRRAVAPPQD